MEKLLTNLAAGEYNAPPVIYKERMIMGEWMNEWMKWCYRQLLVSFVILYCYLMATAPISPITMLPKIVEEIIMPLDVSIFNPLQ